MILPEDYLPTTTWKIQLCLKETFLVERGVNFLKTADPITPIVALDLADDVVSFSALAIKLIPDRYAVERFWICQ